MEKDLWDFLEKVQEMRKNQSKYFKTRDFNALRESQRLEKEVDKMAKDLQSRRNGEAPTLF